MRTRNLLFVLLALLALMPALLGDDGPAGPPGPDSGLRLEARAEAIVTVKAVLKLRIRAMGRTEEEEVPFEVAGTMIAADGLVVTSADAIDPSGSLLESVPEEYRSQFDVQASVGSMKVLLGNGAKERPATLVARDPDLGLAFLRICDLEGERLAAVDLEHSPGALTAQELTTLSRLPARFGRAPISETTRVAGQVETPRPMCALSLAPGFVGLPAFDGQGRAAGLICRVESGEDDGSSSSIFGSMLRSASNAPRTFLVAGQELDRILESARKQAAGSR